LAPASGERFYIVGAGPAGAGAALAASRLGMKPIVYEAMDRPAVKPCGRGIPVLRDLWFARIPRDAVLNRIRSAVMYVNGEFLFELRGVFEGYIVDKSLMLESLIVESGGEIVYRSKYDPRTGYVKTPLDFVRVKSGILAGGNLFYGGEKIMAVQWILGGRGVGESDTLEIYFDTDLLGYYYVFPHGPGEVEVGVGGFAEGSRLRRLLEAFIRSREDLRGAERLRFEGAKIAIGGLDLGYVNGLVKVGEAAGFVMPLTGEGIRPSMISGFVAAKALIEGVDPIEALRGSSIGRAIELQKAILNYVKGLNSGERARILRALGPRAHAEIALGTMNRSVLARELARSRVLSTLLRIMLSKLGM